MGARVQAGAHRPNAWEGREALQEPLFSLRSQACNAITAPTLGSPQHKELLTKQLAASTQEKGRQAGRQVLAGQGPGKLGLVIFSILIQEGGGPASHQVNVSATG